MNKNLLELKEVSVNYYGGYNGCSNVTFTLNRGQILCVLGDRMSGKSTLIKGIVGLESFTGNILLNGKDLSKIAIHDRNFGLSLPLPKKGNIRKALKYPLKLRKLAKDEIDRKVYEIASLFGIVHLLDYSISSLSPELAVYVEVARLFIIDRDIYFIDNIMEKVYITERRVIFPKLLQIIKGMNKTLVFTTDLIEEMEQINADINIYLSYNRMVDSGALSEVMKAPYALDLAKFLYADKVNMFDVDINKEGVYFQGKLVASKINLINDIFTKAIAMILPSSVKTILNGDGKGVVKNIVNLDNRSYAVIDNNQGAIYALVDEGDIVIGKETGYKIDWKKVLYYDSNSEMLISKR